MSLLLQALQKASKNRDENASAESAPAPDPLDSDELMLEPLGAAGQGDAPGEPAPSATASYSSPAQAAAIMQAKRPPAFDPMEYAREHYMIVFIALAFLFAAGYGGYVYLQVANPSWLRKSPPPRPAAPIAATPAPVAAANDSAAEKISGIPAGTPTPPVQATAAPAQPVAQPAAPVNASQPVPGTPAPVALVKTPVADDSQSVRPAVSRPRRAAEETVAREVDEDGIETVVLKPAPARNAPSVEKAEKTAVPTTPPDLMRAYEALQAGEFAEARALYEQVLKSDSRNIDALLGLGAIAWKEGRIEEAMQHYQRVLELEPRNAYAQAGLIAMVGSADPAASETRLRQLIAREPSGFLYFTLGNLYADQGLWPAAQQAYFQAYQSQPENPDYAFNLAVGLEHIGQTRPALDYYRKALDLSFRKGRANFDQSLVIQRVGQLSTRVEQ